MSTASDHIDALLRASGVRATTARRDVYQVLDKATGPLLVADIDRALARSGRSIDLVTVYRTVETLERCGLVIRVDRIGDGWRFATRDTEHQHLIVCSVCGAREPLDQCEIESIDRKLERTTGFSDVHHSVQFFGTCPKCRSVQSGQ